MTSVTSTFKSTDETGLQRSELILIHGHQPKLTHYKSVIDADVKEANKRVQDLRIHQWTPRPLSLGDGYRGSLMDKFCREFARLAVELEEGWL